jgi:predicted nucleotidyltransferase
MPKQSSSSVKVIYPRYSRGELVERLRQGVASLATELLVSRAILFGSCAHDRATAFSDIDLLVVYVGPPVGDAFHRVRHHVRIRGLEPHVYTEEEAAALAPTLDRMTRDGITVF